MAREILRQEAECLVTPGLFCGWLPLWLRSGLGCGAPAPCSEQRSPGATPQ